jgi:hypothetical protein
MLRLAYLLIAVQARVPAAAELTPIALVHRAIEVAGGRKALTRFRAFEWDGRAVVHAGGREVAITGTWQVVPPDTAAVAMYERSKGPESTRRIFLQGADGWTQQDTTRVPLPAAVMVEERHQFYLYSLLRLVPLEEAGVILTAIPNDPAGRPGIRVERPGRLPVSLYFASSGRPARIETRFATIDGKPGDTQEIDLSGTISAAGVSWTRTMRIRRNGTPYFDLELTRLAARSSGR